MADYPTRQLSTLAGAQPQQLPPSDEQNRVAAFHQALADLKRRMPNVPDWLVDNLVTRYFGESLDQAAGGAQKLFGSGKTADERMQGASDVLRGGMKVAAPLLGPAAIMEAPAAALLGMGVGTAAGAGAEALSKKLGLGPGASALAGDVAGIGAGGLAAEPENLEALGRGFDRLTGKAGEERGSIKLGEGETPQPKKVRDVKKRTLEDLDRRIPQEMRYVSPDPTKTVNGQPFSSLDLDTPGEGFHPMTKFGEKTSDKMINRAWKESIQESEMEGGSAAREAVEATGAKPPMSGFWDKAFKLPKRARYWYELSGESFTGGHFDVPKEMQPRIIDAHAGTSGGVEPGPNARRAVGIVSEDVQGQPVMTDLRDPASARKALGERTDTPKFGSFGGTMKFTTGLSKYAPLSTNDVQVASMFGLKGTDIGKNPVLYEVLSRFFIKMRDMQNAHIEPGAQPWETWQMQAPAWVHQRILKNPKKASQYDDYALKLPGIIADLNKAGIPTPGGRITMETLADPRTPNIMSGTREHFLRTPVATVEMGTVLTPEGRAAADLLKQVNQLDLSNPEAAKFARKAQKDYNQIHLNMMSALGKRVGGNKELGIKPQPSLISQLMSEMVNTPIDVSRIDRMGMGTFIPAGATEFEANPNLRIPMTGRNAEEFISLDKTQREAFLSILGQATHQEAMPATLFQLVEHGAPDEHTFSVFLNRYDGKVDQAAINRFSNQLGLPLNVSQLPNGTLIDVNIAGDFGSKPDLSRLQQITDETFGNDPNVHDLGIFARSYDSDYVEAGQYEEKINGWKQTWETQRRAAKVKADESGGRRPVRNTAQRVRNLARVRKAIESHARVRDAKYAEWTAANRARLERHLGGQPSE